MWQRDKMTIECISLQPKTASANIEKTLDSLTETKEKRGKNPLTHSIFLRALFSLFVSRADRLLLLSMLVRTCVYTAKEASERERAKFEDIYDFFFFCDIVQQPNEHTQIGPCFCCY